jgi:acetoin:2,6-dichlorophenolindophenol oxidoreductase subunit alpha
MIFKADVALDVYRRMRLIRVFEEQVKKLSADGEIRGSVHLYSGEEAVAVGASAALDDSDYVLSTHRGHGHCIARGADVRALMAELLGRASGLCKGKGGSLHVADASVGLLGANGIVGAGAPLAVGAALSAKLLNQSRVSVCFFGDGAMDQGAVHEAMNLASVWRLPVVFVCENNQFAEATPVDYHCPVKPISRRADGYGMPGVTVDGFAVEDVYQATAEAVARAREGSGPSLIEAITWRYHGHYDGDPLNYRTRRDVERYSELDPISGFADAIRAAGLAGEDDLLEADRQAANAVAEAVAYGLASPWPEGDELLSDVYAGEER